MSASREKRTRQDQGAQGPNEKQLQRQAEEKKSRSMGTLYTVLGVVIAVAVIALLVMNSSFLKNRTPAATINGQNFSLADVQYYYNNAKQYESYYAMMGYSTYDSSVSDKDQIQNAETGTTWRDYFLDQALESLKRDAVLAWEAEKAGYSLSAEGLSNVDSSLASIKNAWVNSGYTSQKAYLRAAYGSAMSYDKFKEILTRAALASDYAQAQFDSYEYDQATLDSYYSEHKDDLDVFVVSQILFQATVPVETDSEGNPVEQSDEEKAAILEQAKQEAQANAEACRTRLAAGEDVQDLAEEYGVSFYQSEERAGSSLNSEYKDWAVSSARREGDITLVEYQGGSSDTYNYCVARFEGRHQDTDPTSNVRHILISAGSDPDNAAYEEAKTKAEEMLAQWQASGATEESFAQLAMENSADTGSASNGGLISNVSEDSGYVDTFTEWCLDSARKPGDTGVVQNTGSTTKGYHIMYFVDWGDPQWMLNVKNTLRQEDYNTWQESLMEGYTAEQASGAKYVS